MKDTPTPHLFMTELTVANLRKTVDWYVEVLGLKVELLDEPRGFAMMNATSGRLAFKESKGPKSVGIRLIFEVADIAEESRRLGVPDVIDDPEGFQSLRIFDPEGTPITLFAWNRKPD